MCMHMHGPTVVPQLCRRGGRESKPFLRGMQCKLSARDFFGRARINQYNTLSCGTVQLYETSDYHTHTGKRGNKRVWGNVLTKKSLFSHTQGLSGDGVDPAVLTSWVILETTRSAISCLSSSTCSPIRGIELSITCQEREEQQLIRRAPGGRCMFQITYHTTLLHVPGILTNTSSHRSPPC